jgi:hypothetical protein
MNLGFENNSGADLFSDFPGIGGIICHFSPGDLNTVLVKNFFSLILMNFHCIYPFLKELGFFCSFTEDISFDSPDIIKQKPRREMGLNMTLSLFL